MAEYQLAEHRYTDRDVRENSDLFRIATWYAQNYTGDFEFMVDIMRQVQCGIELNVSQVRAVMNCLRNDPRQAAQVPSKENLPEVEAKVIEMPTYRLKRKFGAEVESCEGNQSHDSHWWGKNYGTKCPGVPFEIDRKGIVYMMKTRVKTPYVRAHSSGLIHKVQTSFIQTPGEEYTSKFPHEGYVSWVVPQHKYGYGFCFLYVHTACTNPGTLRNPCLYWKLPDFEKLSELLGKESRTCKKCFVLED